MKSQTFQDVALWRKAHAWVLTIYKFTEAFPKHELFGLLPIGASFNVWLTTDYWLLFTDYCLCAT